MSRTLSQIYSEAIRTRNNYLQITELDSGRTKHKMSMLNLMTYVMSVLIYSYETILDVFEVNIAKLIAARINGTPAWYVTMAYKFQFNPIIENGDPFGFNEDTLALKYNTIDVTHRIVKKAAWQEFSINDGIILKVCKDNVDAAQIENGMSYMKLSNEELAAFKQYIQAIKFVGAKVYCISLPGDLITIRSNGAKIYYNDNYATEEDMLVGIKNSLMNYAQSLEFNQYVYYQSFIDAIQATDYVEDIEAGVIIEARSYNSVSGSYSEPVNIIGQYRPLSGYIGYIDEEDEPTINLTNLELVPISQL